MLSKTPINVSVLVPRGLRSLIDSLRTEKFIMIAWNHNQEPKIYVRGIYDPAVILSRLRRLTMEISMHGLKMKEEGK